MTGIASPNMDRRITLYNYIETKSDTGEPVKTYSLLRTVWAKVEYKTAQETVMQSLPEALATLTFTIRYIDGIDEKTRIIYQSVNYDIIGMAEIGRKRFWQIEAKKPDLQ